MRHRTFPRVSLGLIALAVALWLSAPAFAAATIVIVNNDAAGVGFNDPMPVAPVGGNPGTTLGQQRLNAFQAAANIWGATLTSTVTIRVRAQWAALTCNATGAVLGSAGATQAFRDFAGAPFANTWYGKALANKLFGVDMDLAAPDINATFNVNLGQPGCLTGVFFYLGLDNNHGANVDLVTVLLHEFSHGLGFQTFTNGSTGEYLSDMAGGHPSVYDQFLQDLTSGLGWTAMTAAERAASAINTNNLIWTGPQVTSDVPLVLGGTPKLTVNSPPVIAGQYPAGTAAFGPALTSPGVTGGVALVDDGSGASASLGCGPLVNGASINGKIALVDRGTCTFAIKTKNAQNAGAIGVIIANNAAGPPPGMAGVDPTITIPTLSITQADGVTIKAQLGAGVNATLGLDLTVRAGADPTGRALLYAPNPFQSGSSVSHWDTSALPNQLMEPAINGDLTHNVTPNSDLTYSLLRDIGWLVSCTSIACPANITAPNDPNQCGAAVTYAAPTPPGICGTVNCSPMSGSFFPVGTTTVICISSAGPSCSFTVTVQDTQPPAAPVCPGPITVPNDPNQCGAVVNYTPPPPLDNCPGTTVSCAPLPGSFFSVGTTTVTCTASDASPNSPNTTCSFTVTVTNTAPVLSYGSPQTALVGQTTNFSPATGPTDTNLATIVVQSVVPPPGASISVNNTTGVVTAGNTTQAGTYVVTIRATDTCGVITDATFTLQVGCPAITVDPSTLTNGTVGTAYTETVSGVPAGSYSYAVTSGTLPPGLALNATTGVISGSPTAPGTFSFRLAATVPSCTGFRDYTVTIICPPILITTTTLPAGQAGIAYAPQTLNVTPAGSYTFSLTAGNLPGGLTLNPATGVISGLPSVVGTTTFTVKVQAASGCSATQTYTLAVNCPTVSLTAPPLPGGTVGAAYSATIAASPAGGNYSYAVTAGSLPAGLSLNPATGVLSGTPTSNGSSSFTVTATGFGGCTGSQAYTITVGGAGCPTITLPATLPGGTVGQVYSSSVAASPAGSYTYAVTAGSLPPGVNLFGPIGLLFGYPTSTGTFNFTIEATGANNCKGSQAYTVVIGLAAALAKPSDFDGDGKADTAVFRASLANWLIVLSSNNALQTQTWGAPGDQQAAGDYDGDGKLDMAVFTTTGTWRIKRSSDGGVVDKFWGLSTDVPVPGDYDGDGKTDIAVWRGAQGHWYIVNSSNGAVQVIQWGLAAEPYGDLAVPGDYDGDKRTDLAVFRKQDGTWYIKRSSDGTIQTQAWGLGTDTPVPGDYDGDGQTDIAVWRGETSTWFIIRSGSGLLQMASWGASYTPYNDIPVPGDYDGDGKTDIAVWRPGTGTWYSLNSSDGQARVRQHGQSGDLPVTAKLRE